MNSVVAVIPVFGRGLLVPFTIRRLVRMGVKVVCITEYENERRFCREAGATVTTLMKRPLGEKWNAGFLCAKQFDPDFYLYVGSSDWVSDNWLDVMLPVAENYELTGVLDFYELHLVYDYPFKRRQDYNREEVNRSFKGRKLGHWNGYSGERKGEPIGIGRILRRDFVKRIGHKPFDDSLVKNLDNSMYRKTENVHAMRCDEIKCLSLSTTLWSNRHSFALDMQNEGSRVFNDTEANDFLEKWFPETFKLF